MGVSWEMPGLFSLWAVPLLRVAFCCSCSSIQVVGRRKLASKGNAFWDHLAEHSKSCFWKNRATTTWRITAVQEKKTLLLIIYLWFSHAFLCWNLSRKSSSVEIPVLKGIFSESPIQPLKHPLSLSKPIIRANSLVSKTSRMGQNWEGNVRHTQILSPPIPVNASPHKQRAVPALAGLWHFTNVPTVNVQVKHNHSLVGLFPHFLPCPLCSIFSPGTNTMSRSGVGDDPALSGRWGWAGWPAQVPPEQLCSLVFLSEVVWIIISLNLYLAF